MNPEGYNLKIQKANKKQYVKKKNDPLNRLKHQMDGLASYYKKISINKKY